MAGRGGWGTGTLVELEKGKWTYRLPPHLGRKQTTFRANTRTAAQRESRRIFDDAVVRKDHPHAGRVPTFNAFCETFLSQYQADPHTVRKMEFCLARARAEFGIRRLDGITPEMVSTWRSELPVSSSTKHGYHQALRQVLHQAVAWDLIPHNPAARVKNPDPHTYRVNPFLDWDSIFALAAEMPPQYRAIPVFMAATGLRPEEWVPLERTDISDGVLQVQRVYTRGTLKDQPKTRDSRRRVVLQQIAKDALRDHPARLDTKLLFPNDKGRYINMDVWRRDVWKPALAAAGLEYRRIYDLRHTFASLSLAAGVSEFHVARMMGTSIEQIEKTYGHWVPDSDEAVAGLLDAYGSK